MWSKFRGALRRMTEDKIEANNKQICEGLMPWHAKIENGYSKPRLKPKDPEIEKRELQQKNTT